MPEIKRPDGHCIDDKHYVKGLYKLVTPWLCTGVFEMKAEDIVFPSTMGVPGAPRAKLYRLIDTTDPEERLEDAAMAKAMVDRFTHDNLQIVPHSYEGEFDYGRQSRFTRNPVPELRYWEDPVFLSWARRSFAVLDIHDAAAEVRRLHAEGKSAFVKSTKAKHYAMKIPRGSDLGTVMDAMVYSFIDGGPKLMVQEYVPMQYEHRFFVVGRKIVTDTPNASHLTPIDYVDLESCMLRFKTPMNLRSTKMSYLERGMLLHAAKKIARNMKTPDAVIDLAWKRDYDDVICVELNPLIIGGVGLFASDVRALAKAIYNRDMK